MLEHIHSITLGMFLVKKREIAIKMLLYDTDADGCMHGT